MVSVPPLPQRVTIYASDTTMRLFQRFSGGIFAALLALLCFLAAVRSNAQSPVGCPNISTSDCPSVNWTVATNTFNILLYNGPYSAVCAVELEYCYRCCNGKLELHIKSFACSPCGSLATVGVSLSDPINAQAINQALMEYIFNTTGPCSPVQPCPFTEQSTYEVKVTKSACYRYSGNWQFAEQCAESGLCIYKYKVCYVTLSGNQVAYVWSSEPVETTSGSNTCATDPGFSTVRNYNPDETCYSWCLW